MGGHVPYTLTVKLREQTVPLYVPWSYLPMWRRLSVCSAPDQPLLHEILFHDKSTTLCDAASFQTTLATRRHITASRWACRWRASNHSAFWGLTLDEGIRYRLGTFRPTIPVNKMTTLRVFADDALPATFDAREEWPGFIEAVLDQGNCASSWAFSTTGQSLHRAAAVFHLT